MRVSIACSLTLHHVTENRYVKYPVHNSWRYESIVLTNRIAGERMNIKKIKLLGCDNHQRIPILTDAIKYIERLLYDIFRTIPHINQGLPYQLKARGLIWVEG